MPDLARLREHWTGLTGRGQATLVGSLLAVLVTMFMLYHYGSKPSYVTLASNLQATETGQVTKALESAGITYRLGSGGTEVDVTASQAAAARVALAQQGLPGNAHVGFEIFDKKSLGQTDFQQKVDYQRALEGEIARSIEQIAGVQSAEVQLVLPEDSLFADQGPKATAAVLLTQNGLDETAISGIAHLVASSVKDLDPSRVTITDSAGELLWPTADSASGGLSASSKLQAEQLYAAELSGQINTLLSATLGAGKAQARVHADLSLDQTTIDSIQYGKKGVPLQTNASIETLGSKGTAAGAAPSGTSSNIPSYTANAGSSNGTSNYKNQTSQSTFGVDKTVSRTAVAPGAVKKLDVALLVDSSVPPAQVAALKSAVAGMAGLDPKRGDTLAVSSIKFAKPATTPAAKTGPLATINPLVLAKKAMLGLGVLLFLFLVARAIKRRESEKVAPEPTWLREIEATMPLAALEAGPQRPAIDPTAEQRAALRDEIEEITKAQPDQVATQVAQWMKEE